MESPAPEMNNTGWGQVKGWVALGWVKYFSLYRGLGPIFATQKLTQETKNKRV